MLKKLKFKEILLCSIPKLFLKQSCWRQLFRNFAFLLKLLKKNINHHFSSQESGPISHNSKEIVIEKTLILTKHNISFYKLSHRSHRNLATSPLTDCFTFGNEMDFNSNFTLEDLKLVIFNTKRRKITGPDNLLAEFFLSLYHNIALVLNFFSIIWWKATPEEWRKAAIFP